MAVLLLICVVKQYKIFHGTCFVCSFFGIVFLAYLKFSRKFSTETQMRIYSELSQTSKTALSFSETVNGFRSLTIFCKKLHLRCLIGFWMRLKRAWRFTVLRCIWLMLSCFIFSLFVAIAAAYHDICCPRLTFCHSWNLETKFIAITDRRQMLGLNFT